MPSAVAGKAICLTGLNIECSELGLDRRPDELVPLRPIKRLQLPGIESLTYREESVLRRADTSTT